jgi:glycosyltransferase involved in cell wall biosynthesis
VKILLVSRCAWTLYNFRAGLMRALLDRGDDVAGGGAAGDGYEAKVEALGVPFHPLPVDKKGVNPLADLRLLWQLYRWYRKERPDVVHHFTIKPVIYGSIAARLARVPRIINTVTGLGYVFTDSCKPWLRRLVEGLYSCALRAAHFTFFLNREDQQLLTERGIAKPGKTALLPGSGVDLARFSPHLSRGSTNFLMVARLLRDKGVHEFVEAARLVRQRRPEARFQLLGGRDERNPAAVSQAEVDSWQAEIECLGEVEDVRPFIAEADVVVLPSYYREGVPRSLLEAAAMAKPIITTDAVGCREVVDDGINGLLVPVKDAEALARAMIWMIENPEVCQRMGKAGREKVEREFDEQFVVEKTLNIYEKAVLREFPQASSGP